ncbi:unnamed protein product [Adineta ricciae]|uniref:Uncharacterized protein n=2 Tax=Adineta ricciae TaxID=249248 RepID=A0A815PD31_ADIRI|nr:unnamed protein product [Adineta ricciae]
MFTTTPLSQIDGYIILLSFGIVFSLFIIGITLLLQRFNGENRMSSETFLTANRKIRSGLLSSSIVSSWTWAATLLQSSSVTYSYGISGAFWYANGATIQIILFSIMAVEFKRRAPFAHTYLEAIRARYGREGHWIFILFFLFTNILVTLMLLTGGSAVIHSLCGMPIIAACFLLPLGTIIYTIVGGIKAVFLTNYIHTVINILIILFFALTTYETSSLLGSFSQMYHLLVNASLTHPIEGNYQGSYLTIKSRDGAMFFFINLIGNFGTVFLDNGYYNKAIASSPNSVIRGYILGGLAWFAIPFLTGTTMGLVAVTLETNSLFPTYPNRLSNDDVTFGLTLPAAAIVLLGKSGSIASFIMIYLACTSAMSAQLIAVGSIVTFDIYRTYFHQNASGKRLFFVSHFSLLIFALIMSISSIGLYYVSISLSYLYTTMGIIISSAVLPVALTILWNKQSKLAACLSPPLGLICSISSWLLSTKYIFGKITIQTTGSNLSMLIGNLVALLSPLIFIPLFTFIKPNEIPYDFVSMKEIQLIDVDFPNPNKTTVEEIERGISYLKDNSRFVRLIAIIITICLTLIWPWPMYVSSYVFSETFFTFWICLGIVWLLISFIIVGVYPIMQHYRTIKSILSLIYFDIKAFRDRD